MPDYKRAAAKAKDPVTRANFIRLWREDRARTAITTCTACPLSETRLNAVPWSGPTSSRIVLMGEAPGANEDKQGIPFVGASGRVLDSALKRAGLDRDSIMVMNTIACRPPKNRDPEPGERKACRPHFNRQLSISSAYVGVLMGKQAHGAVTGDDTFKLGEVRGRPFWMDGRVWVTTYHPAYVARNRDAAGLLVSDLALARKITTASEWWPTIDPADIETFGGKSREQFAAKMRRHGYAKVYVPKLKDVIVVTENDKTRLPEPLKQFPRYTMPELVKLGQTAAIRGLTWAEMRRVHLVKASLGGEIVT